MKKTLKEQASIIKKLEKAENRNTKLEKVIKNKEDKYLLHMSSALTKVANLQDEVEGLKILLNKEKEKVAKKGELVNKKEDKYLLHMSSALTKIAQLQEITEGLEEVIANQKKKYNLHMASKVSKYERLEEGKNRVIKVLREKIEDKNQVIEMLQEDITLFEVEEGERPLQQDELEQMFRNAIKEIYNKYSKSSLKNITNNQKSILVSYIANRIGIPVDEKQMNFINSLNMNQASYLIKFLSKISYYDQRVALSDRMREMRNKVQDIELYSRAIIEVKNKIHLAEFFDNKLMNKGIRELEPVTEPQVRKIARLALYPETLTAMWGMGIDIYEFEVRGDKNYYHLNYNKLCFVIKRKFNKDSAKNFLQTYEYIDNYYNRMGLDIEVENEIRNNYIRLGDFEKTRPTFLKTITADKADSVIREQEQLIKEYNKAENSLDRAVYDMIFGTDTEDVQLERLNYKEREMKLTEEEQKASALVKFVFGLYSCVGQDIPEEFEGILPYFNDRGKYAGLEEEHIGEFRRMVFEQREVIKQIDPKFNWGMYLLNQPTFILELLGLDLML